MPGWALFLLPTNSLLQFAVLLMFDAKLIIMDEPTTALTRKEVNALFQIILDLKAQGIAHYLSATS